MYTFFNACIFIEILILDLHVGLTYGNPSLSSQPHFQNLPNPSIGSIKFKIVDAFVTEDGEKCSIENECLSIVKQENKNSSDNLGVHLETTLLCRTNKGTEIHFSTRLYGNGIKVYKHFYADGLNGTSVGDKNGVTSAFPVFRIPRPFETPKLRFVTPGGYMLGWTLFSHGSIEKDLYKFRDGEGGGIVVFSQENEAGVDSVIMAGLNEPMSINAYLDRKNKELFWGIQGLAQEIPPGYTIEIITREDTHSAVQNVLEWGMAELAYYQSSKMVDLTARYLSYWTDNGAAYYYNPDPYASYADLILDISDYAQRAKIPIKSMQIDSWWYHKGAGGGVKNWTELSTAFPNGIKSVKDATGYLITAHNRYFSSDSDYAAQNGGKYPFTIDKQSDKSLPLDIAFWEDLMEEAKLWGLQTYEQDWLNIQYEETSALHTNVTLGSSWLNDMGEAAQRQNINIQYCMALPRHFLQSAKLSSVTQIRVSDDYLLNPDQWQIGKTSLFAHALGLLPFKDLFWTSKVNSGVIYNDCESLVQPDPNDPIAFLHSYKGYRNITEKGIPCLDWSSFGYDAIYPNGDLRRNHCRNPANIKNGAFCFTEASPDSSVNQWKWGFCKPPICEYECYTINGVNYVGNHNETQTGKPCSNWKNEFGLSGSYCRNPSNESQPWCYTDSSHKTKENCSIPRCPEQSEFNPNLQSAVATLSMGPVGIGDKIENLNRDLIMRSCNEHGLLLKPSTPLMVTNAFFTKNIDKVWSAQSVVSGYHHGIIFTAENSKEFNFSALELNLEDALSTRFVFYENYPASLNLLKIHEVNSIVTLPSCEGYMQFCLYFLSPLINVGEKEISILGELTKWTPISPQRIIGMDIIEMDLQLHLLGAIGEDVKIHFYSNDEGVFSIDCNFQNKITAVLSVGNMTCS